VHCHHADEFSRHSVVTTVRSQEKAQKIKDAHSNIPKNKLDFAIVEDIAKESAFMEAVKSDPPFEAVIHTASPFHFNVTDAKKDLLDPAIIGTTGVLKAIKKNAPAVKRVVRRSKLFLILGFTDGTLRSLPRHLPQSLTVAKATGQIMSTPKKTGIQFRKRKLYRILPMAIEHRRPSRRKLRGISLKKRNRTSLLLPCARP